MSKITGRIEKVETRIDLYPRGYFSGNRKARETSCPSCGFITHLPPTRARYCANCGFPLHHITIMEKVNIEGFYYLDHTNGLKLGVTKGKDTVRIFSKLVTLEELKKFVKEHGQKK